MKVRITQISSRRSQIRVRFESTVGTAVAIWTGEEHPKIGSQLDVEIDVNETIELTTNSQIVEVTNPSIRYDDEGVEFIGRIESQDEDGMSYLRLQADCLIMIESRESGIAGKGLKLRVPVERVEIIPIGKQRS